ncbi:MAG: hypothetical protein GWP08_04390 [Nitrospiraceae bacterium]|nr:hypothetical protein [Nitrospiraceae bacterium]
MSKPRNEEHGAGLPDITKISPDLTAPPLHGAAPAAGRRVRQTTRGYEGGDIHHVLYLPEDWKPAGRYPIIVEYTGNAYESEHGDVCTGRVEDANLGYGISGGRGFIWVSMPFVDTAAGVNALHWWGDVAATVDYCRQTVLDVCERYGGDHSAVVLAGFSRGAIACNYIGLHNDEIADLWLAFIAYSNYDGLCGWPYPDSDVDSAYRRLQRINGRASFVCQEEQVPARVLLELSGVAAPFEFHTIHQRNHSDAWVLRDVPERGVLRNWLSGVLETRPGTARISGRITNSLGRGMPGIRVSTGYTHATVTDASGRYELAGIRTGQRQVLAARTDVRGPVASRSVTLGPAHAKDVNFRLS